MKLASHNGCRRQAEDFVDTKKEYRELLRLHIPLYTTRLVSIASIPIDVRDQVRSPEEVVEVLSEYFQDKDREEFLIVLLDRAQTIIGLAQISVGGLAASIVEPRAVFKAAIEANAASIILCHSHPSGNLEPSREDIRITRQLVEGGKIMGIPILDHVIIAEKSHTSLAERGLLS